MLFTVRQRLFAIVGGAILALLITGLIGVLGSRQVADELEFTDENIIRSLAILSSVERDFLLIRVNALYHLSYDDAQRKAPHEATIRRNIAEIRERLAEYGKDLAVNARDRELLASDEALLAVYLDALDRVLDASRRHDREQAVIIIESEWKPAGERLTAAFAEHMRYKERLVDQVVQQSMQTGRRTALIIIVATIAGILFVLAAAWLFRRSLPRGPGDT
ncbi:MCP four helix bundle domain-containing protein [Chitinilyticum litopenaei]|uniref:MCP four helix bundle domain-containing protein n=1 Tax=Chitinilyticum litopenaei TaxID=1121276 RepID=UPI00042287FC|nr:MCP four helix bundle domain-containing protein [Chitinilyticum litopenaei]